MNRKVTVFHRIAMALLMAALLFPMSSVLPQGGAHSVEAAGVKLHKPKRSNGKITYDCVRFGSYPQAEVVTADLLKKYEAFQGGLFCDGNGRFIGDTLYQTLGRAQIGDTEGDFIVDDTLYQTLQTERGWDADGAITLADGERYCRIKRNDAVTDWMSYIDWENDATYHYFKYQPIKWRVLSVKKGEAFLLAQNGLDSYEYIRAGLNEEELEVDELVELTWRKSMLRKWLNSYDHATQKGEIDKTKKGFIDVAFNQKEKNAIKAKKFENKEYNFRSLGRANYLSVKERKKGTSTKDKISILSFDEAANKAYGFSAFYMRPDRARRFLPSAYAQAMGSYFAGYWQLRSVGFNQVVEIKPDGEMVAENLQHYMNYMVVPVLYLNTSASDVWSYAGTVSVEEIKNGLVKENGKYYYYKNNKKRTGYTGLIRNLTSKGTEMCYVKKGVWQSKYTGMVKHAGKWHYVKKGKKRSATGLVKHTDGSLWYVKEGQWKSKYTGIVNGSDGQSYYVEKGRVK